MASVIYWWSLWSYDGSFRLEAADALHDAEQKSDKLLLFGDSASLATALIRISILDQAMDIWVESTDTASLKRAVDSLSQPWKLERMVSDICCGSL